MKFYHSDKTKWHLLKQRAREHRAKPTRSEIIIWNALRNNALGFKFRRQYVIGSYIVDFICLENNLIIEIDGISHIDKESYDKKREIELIQLGFTVIRFTDDEVHGNGNLVVDKIKAILKEC